MSTYRKELRELADRHRATLSLTRGGHYALALPDGRTVYCSYSPRHPQRALKNTEALIRRGTKGGGTHVPGG